MKLAVFDFDSTLIDAETIDALACEFQVSKEVSTITQKAMSGELNFYESLKERVKLLRGMQESKAREICKHLPLQTGAKECVYMLKQNGYKVVCLSGGFKFATEHFKKILKLDAEFSNILHCKNGFLSGEVSGAMMFNDSKGQILQTLQHLLQVPPVNTLVVGDGANDLSMFTRAGKKIAFCAKEILKKHANIIIDKKDLREILYYIH